MTDEAIAAAELALFLLESVAGTGLSGPSPETKFSFGIMGQLVDRNSALQELSVMPKPIACSLKRRGSVMELHCEPPSSDELMILDTRRQNLATGEGVFGKLQTEFANRPEAEIEFSSTRDEVMSVPVRVVVRWSQEYVIRSITQLELSRTKPDDHPAGVTAVITFSTAPQISGLLEIRQD